MPGRESLDACALLVLDFKSMAHMVKVPFHPSSIGAVLALSFFMLPVAVHAEEADPGEIGHAIVILSLIGILFLASLAFGIWLLVARLRSSSEEVETVGPARQPNFEGIWFPTSSSAPTRGAASVEPIKNP